MVWAAVCLGKLFLGERREEGIDEPQMTMRRRQKTHCPLATEGKATVDRFLFSARVRQFLMAFSRLGTASVLFHCGLCTWITCLQGSWSPEPLIAAVGEVPKERNDTY